MIVGRPLSAWSTLPSCTLLSGPTTMRSLSPRSTAVGHTDALAPNVTSPRTTAWEWMKAVAWIEDMVSEGETDLEVYARGRHPDRRIVDVGERDPGARDVRRVVLQSKIRQHLGA